jgi:hypothetical protein
MRCSRKVLSLAAIACTALAAPATSGAETNPYTAAGVCGAGYKPIDRHKLVDGNNGILLAETVLTYNGATGKNCVVTLKRYRVGKVTRYHDNVMAEVYTRPLSTPGNVDSDQGNFAYFAGPVYVSARDKCVQWGGQADLWAPANWVPRGDLHSAFRSGWTHCG